MNGIPKGYKLVPVEPTEEMLYAASWVHGPGGIGEVKRRIGLEYRAAISAAAVLQCEIRLPEKYDESQYQGTALLAVRRWNQCIEEVLRINDLPAPTPPQPIYDEAAERELFESTRNANTVRRNELGDYVLPSAQDAWSGWSQCAQSRAKSVEVGHE